MEEMKIRVIPQMNGNFYIGDATDEDAPLLTIMFHNEAKHFDEEAKFRLMGAVRDSFASTWNDWAQRIKDAWVEHHKGEGI